MKLLRRNCTEFEYKAYKGETSGKDEDGNYTGDPVVLYEDPVTYWGDISVPNGQVVQAFDGLGIRYSHVLLMDDVTLDIKEAGLIIWNGRTYQIKAVLPSLNVLSIALMQCTEDHGDQYIEPDPETETVGDEP